MIKLYNVKRISDNKILFVQDRESIEQVEIPAGWNLENNFEILEESVSE